MITITLRKFKKIQRLFWIGLEKIVNLFLLKPGQMGS